MVMVKETQAKYLTNGKEEQTVLEKAACPDGYKMTEVGMIPEDWNITKLKSICTIINGRGFKPHEWSQNGLPIIRIQNLNGSDDFNCYDGHYDPKIFIQYNQLLFAWSGSRGTSFGPHIWKGGDALLNYHTWKLNIDHSMVGENYFYYALKALTKSIEDAAHGASALVHTQKGEMEECFVPIPSSKNEQLAIAKALSDVDALITSLEKLITKKQAIKTATMQQLLTGKKRLPGFGEGKGYKQTELGEIPVDWLCVKLVDITELGTGNTPSTLDSSNYGNDYLFVSPSDLGWQKWVKNTDKKLSPKGFSLSRKFPANSILFTCIGSTIGKIGIASLELTSNQQINAVFPNDSCNSEYIYYSLDYAVPRIKILAGHQAVPIINKTEFGETLIPLPKINDEQTSIATVLSDMDSEVDALENRLSKTQKIKQGMMQELLTGKTRLI